MIESRDPGTGNDRTLEVRARCMPMLGLSDRSKMTTPFTLNVFTEAEQLVGEDANTFTPTSGWGWSRKSPGAHILLRVRPSVTHGTPPNAGEAVNYIRYTVSAGEAGSHIVYTPYWGGGRQPHTGYPLLRVRPAATQCTPPTEGRP